MASPKVETALISTAFPVDFLCIGAQKACTSWLNLILKSDLNKSIFIPYLKETFYLNLVEGANKAYPPPGHTIDDYIYSSFRIITEGHIREAVSNPWGDEGMTQKQVDYIRYLCKSLRYYWTGLNADWYKHLFSAAEPGQMRGELTPDYSFLGKDLIASLHRTKPSLKIMLITRDPVARDLSQLKMQLLPKHPDPTDEQCMHFLGQPHVRNRSDYRKIAQRWTSVFGAASMMTIDAKHIATNPRNAIDHISNFLGIDLQIEDSVLMSRDNISASDWKPSDKVRTFLEDYYSRHNVYGDLMAF